MKINLYLTATFYGSFMDTSKITHNDRVDSLWECATKQAVMTVAQWHRNQIIRGPLVIGCALI
jgi:hypothetical protein